MTSYTREKSKSAIIERMHSIQNAVAKHRPTTVHWVARSIDGLFGWNNLLFFKDSFFASDGAGEEVDELGPASLPFSLLDEEVDDDEEVDEREVEEDCCSFPARAFSRLASGSSSISGSLQPSRCSTNFDVFNGMVGDLRGDLLNRAQ